MKAVKDVLGQVPAPARIVCSCLTTFQSMTAGINGKEPPCTRLQEGRFREIRKKATVSASDHKGGSKKEYHLHHAPQLQHGNRLQLRPPKRHVVVLISFSSVRMTWRRFQFSRFGNDGLIPNCNVTVRSSWTNSRATTHAEQPF